MKIIKVQPLNRRQFARILGLGSLGFGLLETLGLAQQIQQRYQYPNLTPEQWPKFPENISELKLNQPLVYSIWRYVGSIYYFQPFGIYVKPGETVGFVNGGSSGRTPTITAYHPNNDNHELRIPENATPFDSGEMPERGSRTKPTYEVKLEVEGTYDYFSRHEEWIGMIGRIVVGKPGGPGEKPWGYGNKEGRKPIPPEVLRRVKLLNSEEIVSKNVIDFPFWEFFTPYPLW